jgi:uncharacterized protein
VFLWTGRSIAECGDVDSHSLGAVTRSPRPPPPAAEPSPAHGEGSRAATKPVWLFFALTFAWSWFFWGLAIVSGREWTAFPTVLLYVLGGFGPSLAAILLVQLGRGGESRSAFWRRVRDARRISPTWYATIVAVAFIPSLISRVVPTHLAPAIGGGQVGFTAAILVVAVGAAFAEELGWRGYALDGLLARSTALTASLVVGIAWTLWHLPFYFIPGTIQNEAGLWSLDFWSDMLTRVPLAVLFAWVYVNAGRSILSALLLHALDNIASVLVGPEGRQALVRLVLVTGWAAALVVIWGPTLRVGRERLRAPVES